MPEPVHVPSVCAAKRLTVPDTYPGPVAVQLRAVAGIVSSPERKLSVAVIVSRMVPPGVERALTTIVSGPDDAGISGTVSGSAFGEETATVSV